MPGSNGNGRRPAAKRKPSKKPAKGLTAAAEEIRQAHRDIVSRVTRQHDLSLVEAVFVQEYLVALKPIEAYRRAYAYIQSQAGKNGQQRDGELSYNACCVEVNRLMKRPNVQAAIVQAMEERIQRLRVNQDKVVAELSHLAFSDISDVASWGEFGVRYPPSSDLPKHVTAAIQSIEETITTVTTAKGEEKETRKIKIRMHPKHSALESLAKHLGMYIQRFEFAFQMDKDPAEMTVKEKIEAAKKIRERRLQLVQGGKK